MPVTERQIQRVKGIILDGVKLHFPSTVQFQGANATVMLDADDEEYISVELLYTAPNPVLDGHLMNTLFKAIDEPIRASGVTAHTLVNYTHINDTTRWQNRKLPTPPSPVS